MNIGDIFEMNIINVIGCAYNKNYKHGIEFYSDRYGGIVEYEEDIFIADAQNNIMKNFDNSGMNWGRLTLKRKRVFEL